MKLKDNYNNLRDRVYDFGESYFNKQGDALIKEMEDYITGESNNLETDIVDNVLKNKTYSEKIKKEAEAILEDATRARSDFADINKIFKPIISPNLKKDSKVKDSGFVVACEEGDKWFNEQGEPDAYENAKIFETYEDADRWRNSKGEGSVQEYNANSSVWETVETKQVLDSDGFWTEYTWYKDNNGHHVMIFGDTDLYTPENSSADAEFENEEEAKEWFDNYEGFEDEDEEFTIEDTDVDDVFIQDNEGDLFDVIAFKIKPYEKHILAEDIPENEARELVEKYKQEHPEFNVYAPASKKQTEERKEAYKKTDEYSEYCDKIYEALEKEINPEDVFNDNLRSYEKFCEEIIPDEIANDDIKYDCLCSYAEEAYNELVEEAKKTSEYEDLEEQAAAEARDYEAMVDYHWYHR